MKTGKKKEHPRVGGNKGFLEEYLPLHGGEEGETMEGKREKPCRGEIETNVL